jgi:hypothetical protein
VCVCVRVCACVLRLVRVMRGKGGETKRGAVLHPIVMNTSHFPRMLLSLDMLYFFSPDSSGHESMCGYV